MGEDPRVVEQRHKMNLAGVVDPRNYDPRKVMDSAGIERLVKAQVAARVQAQQATTVFLATVVSLITSAFGFVAALAWNGAIQTIIKDRVQINQTFGMGPGTLQLIYALIVTLIAVLVVFLIRNVASRIVGKDVGNTEHML